MSRTKREGGRGSDAGTAEAILAAAAALMPDYGYGRVTVRDLARRAGVGLGTVYGHFPGKDAVAAELVARGVAAVHAAMAASGMSDLPPADRLRRTLAARVTERQGFGRRHPVNEGTPELAAVLAPRRAAWRAAERGIVAEAVAAGQRAGAFVPGDPGELARTLLWATDGLVAEALMPPAEAAPSDPPPHPRGVPVAPSPEALSRRAGRVAALLVAGLVRVPPGDLPVR